MREVNVHYNSRYRVSPLQEAVKASDIVSQYLAVLPLDPFQIHLQTKNTSSAITFIATTRSSNLSATNSLNKSFFIPHKTSVSVHHMGKAFGQWSAAMSSDRIPWHDQMKRIQNG
ncbi:hypothetical protein CEXT_743581 [Caerostris extrusa]|uniref:Uncharacterized protein n=1 Tax=Caerostris extrusa TaxID=172846 RepID=A0AAV4MBT5_CAEEX|nr:hypothetical protein CEXT_743581 [Caerostris extrusa]